MKQTILKSNGLAEIMKSKQIVYQMWKELFKPDDNVIVDQFTDEIFQSD